LRLDSPLFAKNPDEAAKKIYNHEGLSAVGRKITAIAAVI